MSIKKRKIIAVTGARSDYDLLTPVYEKLSTDKRFEFQLLVTGSHLSDNFGKTITNIESDGFEIADRVYNLVDSNDKIGRIISIGNQINGLTQTFNRVKPDIVLVAGDREEAITTAMTCAYMDIPIAHFFGGDIAKDGNIDNSVRYATSKFAHIHFPTIQKHKENLLRLGEEENRIFVVGNPALDKFVSTKEISTMELSKRLNFSIEANEKYLVLIQHSIINQVEKQEQHIKETLEAIIASGYKCFINFPNSDAGHFAIIEAYRSYAKKYKQLKLFQNLDRETYINLLRNAACLLGNSSSGILEAPSIKLPAINIGLRQRGRLHGDNVLFVENNKTQILIALNTAINDKNFIENLQKSNNPYGDGKTSQKVVKVLTTIKLDDNLIYKNITY